jgi:translation initiation factor IF-1
MSRGNIKDIFRSFGKTNLWIKEGDVVKLEIEEIGRRAEK